MNNQAAAQLSHDQLGRKIAMRLSAGNDELDHDILERLRVARQQAIARRKIVEPVAAAAVSVSGGSASLYFSESGPGLWSRLAAALPLLALVAGLLTIYVTQADDRADEVAELDAALLTDALPPAAYADPGFLQFLKSDRSPTRP